MRNPPHPGRAAGAETGHGHAAGLARDGVPTALLVDLIARNGAVWVREASPSMSPLIRPGDEVRLVPLDRRRIGRGTLVAYRQDERLVLHRVLARTESGLVVKGDALASSDLLVGWTKAVARAATLRRPSRRPADLDAFPWPLVNRALGVIAAIGSRLPVEETEGGMLSLFPRLAWKVLRVPFHLARLLVP